MRAWSSRTARLTGLCLMAATASLVSGGVYVSLDSAEMESDQSGSRQGPDESSVGRLTDADEFSYIDSIDLLTEMQGSDRATNLHLLSAIGSDGVPYGSAGAIASGPDASPSVAGSQGVASTASPQPGNQTIAFTTARDMPATPRSSGAIGADGGANGNAREVTSDPETKPPTPGSEGVEPTDSSIPANQAIAFNGSNPGSGSVPDAPTRGHASALPAATVPADAFGAVGGLPRLRGTDAPRLSNAVAETAFTTARSVAAIENAIADAPIGPQGAPTAGVIDVDSPARAAREILAELSPPGRMPDAFGAAGFPNPFTSRDASDTYVKEAIAALEESGPGAGRMNGNGIVPGDASDPTLSSRLTDAGSTRNASPGDYSSPATNPAGVLPFAAAPRLVSVPEPASLALIGLGLASLGWGRRRRA